MGLHLQVPLLRGLDMEPTIAIAGIFFALGCLGGIYTAGRHYDIESEQAYLSGHVDGYNAAMHDSGGAWA